MMSRPRVDRISALSDDILCHILSFLPTKVAFKTSILSKRWMPLCYSLSAIHFDIEAVRNIGTHSRIHRSVDAVMLSPRVQHHPLETFCLISQSEFTFHADKWVEAAKQRRVQNLLLSGRFLLSPTIFTSPNLVVLKLSELSLGHQVGSVDLPLLRTLHLINVRFRKNEDVKKILSGCPILVDLNASVSSLEGGCTAWCKTLPNLVKARIRSFDVPFSAVYNVQFLRIEMMEGRASDKYINSYYSGMPVFRNLINIELCFDFFFGWDRVVEMLSYCPKLQTLVIDKSSNKQISKEQWEPTKPVPECVPLHLTTCSIVNFQWVFDDFDFAAYILQNARHLQVLTLHIKRIWDEIEHNQYFKQLLERKRISSACKIEIEWENQPKCQV